MQQEQQCALCEVVVEAGGVLILAMLFAIWFWGIIHYPLPALVAGSGGAALVIALGRWSRSHRQRH